VLILKGLRQKLTSLNATLTQKRGGGGRRCIPSTFGRADVPTNPSVPLQPDFLGATMSEVPQRTTRCGKHFSPRRCLRVRERTSGIARHSSPLQVVPGSSVLTRRAWVSGFVLTNPELKLDQQGGSMPAVKQAGKHRVGKAGSVRLG